MAKDILHHGSQVRHNQCVEHSASTQKISIFPRPFRFEPIADRDERPCGEVGRCWDPPALAQRDALQWDGAVRPSHGRCASAIPAAVRSIPSATRFFLPSKRDPSRCCPFASWDVANTHRAKTNGIGSIRLFQSIATFEARPCICRHSSASIPSCQAPGALHRSPSDRPTTPSDVDRTCRPGYGGGRGMGKGDVPRTWERSQREGVVTHATTWSPWRTHR